MVLEKRGCSLISGTPPCSVTLPAHTNPYRIFGRLRSWQLSRLGQPSSHKHDYKRLVVLPVPGWSSSQSPNVIFRGQKSIEIHSAVQPTKITKHPKKNRPCASTVLHVRGIGMVSGVRPWVFRKDCNWSWKYCVIFGGQLLAKSGMNHTHLPAPHGS